MDFNLADLKPEIIIQGGAVIVALVLAWSNRAQSKSLSTILGNHLKHIEEKQGEDIESRIKLAGAIQVLNNNIQFHMIQRDNQKDKVN